MAKKIGVDPHKGEVLQVYRAMEDVTGLNVESDVAGPSKVFPSNPLWYLFRSELDVVADSVVPNKEHVLSLNPQNRVKERLGENAGFMLGVYCQVQAIVREEILSSVKGASPKSPIGKMQRWIGNLPHNICESVFQIEEAVGMEAYELTEYWQHAAGRCKCSAVKVIRFGWKTSPIPNPSFFWGCSRYTPADAFMHDKGVPIKRTCWDVLGDMENRGKSADLSDSELERLANKFILVDEFWLETVPDLEETTIQQYVTSASLLYGGPTQQLPLADIEAVKKVVQCLRDQIKFLKEERITAVVRHEE